MYHSIFRKLKQINKKSLLLDFDRQLKTESNAPKYIINLINDGYYLKLYYQKGKLCKVIYQQSEVESVLPCAYYSFLNVPLTIKIFKNIVVEGSVENGINKKIEFKDLLASQPYIYFYQIKNILFSTYCETIAALKYLGFNTPLAFEKKLNMKDIIASIEKFNSYRNQGSFVGILIKKNIFENFHEATDFSANACIYLWEDMRLEYVDDKIIKAGNSIPFNALDISKNNNLEEEEIKDVEEVLKTAIDLAYIIEDNKKEKVEKKEIKTPDSKKILTDSEAENIKHFVKKAAMNIKIENKTIYALGRYEFLRTIPDLYKLKKYKKEILAKNILTETKLDRLLDNIEKSRNANKNQIKIALSIPINYEILNELEKYLFNFNQNEKEIMNIQISENEQSFKQVETFFKEEFLEDKNSIVQPINEKKDEVEVKTKVEHKKTKKKKQIVSKKVKKNIQDKNEEIKVNVETVQRKNALNSEKKQEKINEQIINDLSVSDGLEKQEKTKEEAKKEKILDKQNEQRLNKQKKELEKSIQKELEKKKKEEILKKSIIELEEKKIRKEMFLAKMTLNVELYLLNLMKPNEIQQNLETDDQTKKVVANCSTFKINTIGPIIAQLMTVFQGEEFFFVNGHLKKQGDIVFQQEQEELNKYYSVTKKIQDSGKISFEQYQEEQLKKQFLYLGETKDDEKEITFFKDKESNAVNFIHFQYVQEFIAFVTSEEAKKSEFVVGYKPNYTKSVLNQYLTRFLKGKKLEIKLNKMTRYQEKLFLQAKKEMLSKMENQLTAQKLNQEKEEKQKTDDLGNEVERKGR